jgi:hypothetical protein
MEEQKVSRVLYCAYVIAVIVLLLDIFYWRP